MKQFSYRPTLLVFIVLIIFSISGCQSRNQNSTKSEIEDDSSDSLSTEEETIIMLEQKVKDLELLNDELNDQILMIEELEEDKTSMEDDISELKASLSKAERDYKRELSDTLSEFDELLETLENDYISMWYETDGDFSGNRILFNGVGLKDSKARVEQVFGADYGVSWWENSHSLELFGDLWSYEGVADFYFVGDEVVEILLFSEEIETNIGVRTGDNYYKSLVHLYFLFDNYVSIHSLDGSPNPGWYQYKDEVLIVAEYDEDNYTDPLGKTIWMLQLKTDQSMID